MAAVAGYIKVGVSYEGRNDAKIKVAGFKAGSIIDSSTGYYPGVPGYGGETWLRIWILALCLERRVKLLSGSA